jgi:putative salt-induced outer membrane protein YdiY
MTLALDMKRILFFILFLITFSTTGQAQIVNVESLRQVSDSSKWSGSASVDVALIENSRSIFRLTNRLRLQYSSKKSLYLFINDINLQKIDENSLVNRGIHHIRYNRYLNDNLKLEAFVQSQYDAISNIDFRGLLGVGLRKKLSKNDKYRFFLGSLIMYEYEEATITSIEPLRDFRNSTYLSFSLYPKENISIVSTTYYQPLLKRFSDFRISNETTIAFKVLKNMAFKTSFIYNYDAKPIIGIPNTQYELTNGLVYSFD